MNLRHFFAALVLLFPVVSFAQSAPQNCVDANGYICNWAVDPTTSIALGNMSGANGQYTTAIGNGAVVNPGDDFGTAIGAWAMVLAPGSTAIGFQASATGNYSLAEGYEASAAGFNSTAVGNYAYAPSNNSDAFGTGAYAGTNVPYFTGEQGVDSNGRPMYPIAGDLAVGGSSAANGIGNTAIGWSATATGVSPCTDYTGATCNPNGSSTAIGYIAVADGWGSTALGSGAYAHADFSTAIGESSFVDPAAKSGTAIGQLSYVQSTATNSVALGAGSVASDADTVSLGSPGYTRRIEFVSPGFQATDGVNFGQLSGVTSFLGGGAGFDAQGNPIAPMYVLTNPYTAGDYSTVGDAITALDKAISGVKSTPGPQGPAGANGSNGSNGAQGPAGPQGPQGPAGKDGTGNGSGNDPLAVHYDDTSLKSVTLGRQPNSNGNQTANAIGGPVAVHNLADGTAPDDAVNVSQLEEALASANNYTNIKTTQVLNEANAYTDFRVGQLNGRIKRAIAIATAQAQMVATYAGADPSSANRVAVGTGWEGGYGAMAVGYQHVSVESKHRITWNVGASISGGDGSVGGGVGFSW